MELGSAIAAVDAFAHEIALFAAVGFLIGGLDDLAVDLIFLARARQRRILPLPARAAPPRWYAILVPSWDEAAVIAAMLDNALRSLDHPRYRIYVGTYPNDPATNAAVARVAARDPRVRIVIGARPGPTTKGDNINSLWRALQRDEAIEDARFDAVVFHDAEDVVHRDELRVFDHLLAEYSVIQLPVRPLIAAQSPWVSGHYADEFAEVQDRNMIVRQALGAGLPLAGVGCAIGRDALARLAERNDGDLCDANSLTEDYELGLALGANGERACFARYTGSDGRLVAVRAYFPAALGAAVRQKARWVAGIALMGWDRLGWGRGRAIGEAWMRMRDRRAPIAMVVLVAAYAALGAGALAASLHVGAQVPVPPLPGWMAPLFAVNSALLAWRLATRCTATTGNYGWREGLRAMPRLLVCNFVALLAARRALTIYARSLRGLPTWWDKTAHDFPSDPGKV